jgi:ribosomal protein S18 acetylase RimI-like enzyme
MAAAASAVQGREASEGRPASSGGRDRDETVGESEGSFGEEWIRVRNARPEDEAALCRVCLLTGDAGRDASELFSDKEALGRRFTIPYQRLEPELAFAIEDAEGVCGYVLGALDSARFYERMEREYLPALRLRFADPAGPQVSRDHDQQMYHLYHHFEPFCPPELLRTYPSHLHIDLLPRVQGRGIGRRAILHLLHALRARGSEGVHLELSAKNDRAFKFYSKLGFKEYRRTDEDIIMVRSLCDPLPSA